MPKQKKPTFEDNGYEVHNGCRIRQIKIIGIFQYYQVILQRLSGEHLRQNFITVKNARSFAEQIDGKGSEGGIRALQIIDPNRIDAVKTSILKFVDANFRKAA